MPSKESVLVNGCIRWLWNAGVFCWRNNTGGAYLPGHGGKKQFVRFGVKGGSDILGVLRPSGRLLAIECKVAPNKPTREQADFLREVILNGGVARVVYSLEQLVELMREIKYGLVRAADCDGDGITGRKADAP